MPHIPDPLLSSLSDPDLLFIVLYGEVRGEPREGQIATAASIRNRVLNSQQHYGRGWSGVILRWAQYSCLWPSLGGRDWVAVKSAAGRMVEMRAFLSSLSTLANGIYHGLIPDPTGGATHYLTTSLLQSDPPTWVDGAISCGTFGHQTFFRGVA